MDGRLARTSDLLFRGMLVQAIRIANHGRKLASLSWRLVVTDKRQHVQPVAKCLDDDCQSYTFNVPPRCPRCRSSRIEKEIVTFYD